jgi:hypothetical protein
VRQLPRGHFPLDLQTDQREEHGHQSVVDPPKQQLGDLERSQPDGTRRMEQTVIELGQRPVGQDQRQNSRAQQQEPAGRIELLELTLRRGSHRRTPMLQWRRQALAAASNCPGLGGRDSVDQPGDIRWKAA